MSTRHDPAAAGIDPAAAGDAWLDVAPAGASAWDDQSDGDASAWAGSAEPAGSVWDDDAPASASVWDDDAPAPGSVWDDDAPAPGSVWDDDAPAPGSVRDDESPAPSPVPDGAAHASVREGGTDAPAPARGGRARGTAPERAGRTAAGRRGRAGVDGAGSAEHSPEVAAVAARLAEIVARSGGGRAASTAATTTGTATETPAAAPGLPGAAGAPDPDGPPVVRRGPTGDGPGDRGRRRTSGRRLAPATEPPETGTAATDAEPDPESVARAIALRQLTAAPRSRAQLAEAMAKRDVPEDVADRVLDRFTEVGLVDDAAYAEILVRSRHAERGMSRRALAMELRRKGVDDEVAREALEQVDDADEEQAARALARKKLRATRGLDREVRLRRAYGALGRRGYGGSLVSRVVREELAAEGEDAGDS
ncbi:RecX family transcriptional regulator [Cellulomonas sp. ACRRI]|uniref:regulatory protein RecX n=1 Tax=Cellulomonas sp. ACRRI TaxID=2918188 RepID=UPI001EF288A7|nr:regulatory protein RecX [Cellulomonas sp. ACRRI]MCG7285022.1 RecX family transcriptional regulator [Cellulomonas sp. ACRRI]